MTSIEMVIAYLAAGVAHTLMRFLLEPLHQKTIREKADEVAQEFGGLTSPRSSLYLQILIQTALWPFSLVGLAWRLFRK
jgi:hypothetical protein